jgi:hypothetical protein
VSDLPLEELARLLDPARYADLPSKPRANGAEVAWFEAALVLLVESQTRAVNVRRIFYLAVSAKVVNKTEQEAERVQKCVLKLRREGRISYEAIVDELRNVIAPPLWADARDFLDSVIPQFRTDPWADVKTLVLVFSEKAGMSPILREVTERYAVPLFPTGGYASETFTWDAAQLATRAGKPVVVLQVGDYDNSGLDMMRAAEGRLRAMVAPLPVRFVRVAIKPDHIAQYDLPTRPQKEDKRGLIAVDRAVEIDAMDPDDVQALLVRAIRQHLPVGRLAAHEAADEAVRERLRRRR